MSVKNLHINPRYVSALLSAHIFDVKKLLCYSRLELIKKTGLSEAVVNIVFEVAAKSVCPTPWTSLWNIVERKSPLLYQHEKISTGCPLVDEKLNGGIVFPGVTEVAGESASGKTQLCMQLCLNVQKLSSQDKVGTGALYVCTEDAFPTKRLHHMAQEFAKSNHNTCGQKTAMQLTDHIYIEHTTDLDDLWSLLDVRLSLLLSRRNIKLVIIDSIAALFRAEYNLHEIVERAKVLAKFGKLLHNISHQYKLCVVCVNQVSDVFDDHTFMVNNRDGLRNVTPALGLTWAYFVNTRLMLWRTKWKTSMWTHLKNKEKYDTVVRSLKVVFSAHLPQSTSYVIVDEQGMKDFEFVH